jgi:hypothetical protein
MSTNHGANLKGPEFDAVLIGWAERDVLLEASLPVAKRIEPGRVTGYQRAQQHWARLSRPRSFDEFLLTLAIQQARAGQPGLASRIAEAIETAALRATAEKAIAAFDSALVQLAAAAEPEVAAILIEQIADPARREKGRAWLAQRGRVAA